MSSQLIAPVNPSLTRPAVRGRGRTGQGRRRPLAIVAEVPALADDVLYGVGRIDASGRVGDRAFTSALGWRPGDRLTLTAADGVVIARRDPGAGPRYCGDPLYSSLAAADPGRPGADLLRPDEEPVLRLQSPSCTAAGHRTRMTNSARCATGCARMCLVVPLRG
jgi:hypothetical protein